MSTGNKYLHPVPSDPKSGLISKVEKQYKGLKRIVRDFELEPGEAVWPDNIEEYVFDTYGLKDGQTDSPWNFGTEKDYLTYENCYLDEQQLVKPGGNRPNHSVRKIYQEAYDTIREIQKPRETYDENGRRFTDRTYVILNSAPDANKYGTVGTTADPDFSDSVLLNEEHTVGNAVTIIRRRFIQATDELAQVGEDDYEIVADGFLRVTRDFIGTHAAPDGDDEVGVDTITVDGTTLYLGGIDVTQNGAVKRVQKAWVEPGILSQGSSELSEGVKQKSITFLAVEQSVDGPITSRRTSNFEGLKTISLTYLQNSDGDSLVGDEGAAKLADSYQKTANFSYPGEVTISATPMITGTAQSVIFGNPRDSNGNPAGWNAEITTDDIYDLDFSFVQYPPVTTAIPVTVEVWFQQGDEITEDEKDELWAPDEWARISVRAVSGGNPVVKDQGLRSYRAANREGGFLSMKIEFGAEEEVTLGTRRDMTITVDGSDYTIENGFLDDVYMAGTTVNQNRAAQMDAVGGPERPDGNEYILPPIDIRPAFTDVDGVKYYKKTIVRATIPDRGLT